MAHLWQEDTSGRWTPIGPRGEDGIAFGCDSPETPRGEVVRGEGVRGEVVCGKAASARPSDSMFRVVPTAVPGSEWAVVASPGDTLWVNGSPESLGLRVLADRDELAVFPPEGAAVRRYFSTEEAVCVTAYPAGEKPVRCPRCKKEITEGTPVVRCPNPQCRAWHHQIPAGHEKHKQRECWTYAEKCALCSQTTALDAGFRWTPDEL